jgi:hypothetical protein
LICLLRASLWLLYREATIGVKGRSRETRLVTIALIQVKNDEAVY